MMRMTKLKKRTSNDVKEDRGVGKAASSLVIYMDTWIPLGKLRMGRNIFRTLGYE